MPRLHIEQHDADVTARPAHDVERVGFAGALQGVASDAEQTALEGEFLDWGFRKAAAKAVGDSAKAVPTPAWACVPANLEV